MRCLLLLSFCSLICLSGCRRKPIEPQTETQTQKQTQSETEKQTETKKQTETRKQTETKKKTETQKATAAATPTPQTEQVQAPPTAPPSQQCPYCGNWYYTTAYADGTSDYSNHVAEEEQAAIPSDYDPSQYYTGNDGTEYAQCQYCFQWFSTVPDASGYSQYADHVAAEAAYAATLSEQQQEDYVQCPNCVTWVTGSEYQDHIANGY